MISVNSDKKTIRYAACIAVGMTVWLLSGAGSAQAQYQEAYQRDLNTLIPGEDYSGPRPTFGMSNLSQIEMVDAQEGLPFPDHPIEVSEYELTQDPFCGYGDDQYDFQLLPTGHIYKAHLANVQESRLSVKIGDLTGFRGSTILDGNLGGRFGVFRYGNHDPFLPQGVQWDVEGSAKVRLDIPEDVDVRSADFRAGTQLTWSYRDAPNHRTRFGYYHLSSHLGDEFLLKNPSFPRLNYSRDVLILGHSIYLSEKVRVYGQIGWAFYSTISEPWEFDFGFEWAPTRSTGIRGEPFFAIDGHLREEVNFGGSVTVQTGWAWVGDDSGHLLRMGLNYYNGNSSQLSFYQYWEQQVGFGIWYDY
ncbi:DUF1207 domain-containing protein [Blastopirellula sp. JC732]|uniref:DUF1207 domain-containing protein n=1 Tax=Blastopirellula sediminis TaxID=2894196 RepID=A0A9X1MHF9_9BACT|nr:DUF1207 domain-containing protein [Blastopirellula sediminis]MCC9604321.1 DUF1207 domain-containing protein [Blastopirellula sediminis]MCC9626841.1 DUF1207 domain-containing protein [Blastopirellula sediminis]